MDRKTIGRYEILDELGRGAMGSVLRARDPAMGRVIAIKCIHAATLAGDQAKEFRERFYREARAAGALSHPGIVPVFDVGEDDGIPFLVMELVQGRTLDSAIKQGERYSLEQVCSIGQHIADALGYAHRNGVVHRDIKPANILMTSREVYGAERPRITDFGVAKLAGGELTSTGQLLGTPAFMPPEQFTGAPIDGRTDLFAVGVILYRMATGEQPFPGETLTAVSYKVVHTEPIPPSKLNPAVPRQMEAIILKCLAKSPTDRYQTGEELAADLATVMSGARTTGAHATTTRTLAGETIDQVASLRPQPPPPIPAAETVESYRPAARSAPMWQPPTAPPQPSRPAPPPPIQRSAPPAPPSAPPVPQNAPVMRAAPVAPSAPPPAPTYQRPAFAAAAPLSAQPPAPQPAPIAPPPAPAHTVARPPLTEPAHTSMMSATAVTRNYAPAPHPDAKIRPPQTLPMESSTMSSRAGRSAHSAVAEMPARGKKKRGMSPLMWLLFLAIAGGGTWMFLQLHVQTTTSAPDGGPATILPAGASVAPVDFNPKTLDPKTSARLSLDMDSLPAALTVIVQMDGKTYWTGAAGDHDSASGLMLPPGQHTLRAIVSAGGAQKASGNVGAQFEAGKRMTLTVKLWPETTGAFDPSADVIVSLQRNLF